MKRLNVFDGMKVSLFDLTFSTVETTSGIRQRISDLYNYGIINGLTIFSSSTSGGTVAVTPGTAYDTNGERIYTANLQDLLRYSGSNLNSAVANYTVVARYNEGNDGTSGLNVAGASNFRHITDDFSIVVLKSGVDTLQSADVRLGGIITTLVGSTLIVDSNVRDTFSSKFQASLNISTTGLNVTGLLTVGGTASFATTVNFNGPAIFNSTLTATSNITTAGDFINSTAGKGLIVLSPDGTKQARIGIDNSGFVAIDTLNYTL